MSTVNHDILQAAIRATAERGTTHGTAEMNFTHTAQLWSAYMGFTVNAFDVAQMMVLAKISRSKTGNAGHPDHYVDQCGYSALAGRMVFAMTPQEPDDGAAEMGRKFGANGAQPVESA
jgi:hypothetical protein